MQRAFDEIDAALANGEIVGIFPEGALTKDGEIAPFKSGVETHPAARRAGAGRADGAARDVDQHVEPSRRPPAAACACRGASARTWRSSPRRRSKARSRRAESLEARVRELRGDAA